MDQIKSIPELEKRMLDKFIEVLLEYQQCPTDEDYEIVFEGIEALHIIHSSIGLLNDCNMTAELSKIGDV